MQARARRREPPAAAVRHQPATESSVQSPRRARLGARAASPASAVRLPRAAASPDLRVKNQFAAMAATAATMLRATSAAAAMTTRMRGAASGENRPGAAGAFARRRAAAAPRRDAPLPRDRARRRECRASAHFRRAPSAMVSWEDSAAQQKRVSQVGGERFVDFFRTAAPYIVNHSGGTFVIVIPGGVMRQRDVLEGIVTDVALLQSLG
eukprot:30918-Pelagococcus_subviridis.AAC.1